MKQEQAIREGREEREIKKINFCFSVAFFAEKS
jgi:hypothetical protein